METVLNFLPAFTLFGSVLVFWLTTIVLLVIFEISDIYENGYVATFALSIFIFATWRWSDFNVFSYITLWNVSTYLVTGFIYAGIKSLFYGRQIGKTMSDGDSDNYYHKDYKWTKKSLLKKLKSNVSRWWLLWPVSLINWILSDLVKDVYNWVYDKIRGFFIYLFELGLKDTDKGEDDVKGIL